MNSELPCFHRIATALAALSLGAGGSAALAQAPVSTQGAVSSALGAPAQAKVAAPPSVATVTPGAGGLAPAPASSAEQGRQALFNSVFANPIPINPANFETRSSPAYMARAADYDRGKPVQVRGTVARVEWINPSAIIHMTDDQGRAWTIVNATPNSLLRNGLDRTVLAAGAEVVLQGSPAINQVCADQCRGEGLEVTVGGRTYSLIPPAANPAQARADP